MSADRLTFEHEVEGLARPVTIAAEFDAGDPSVGIWAGWWLVEASIAWNSPGVFGGFTPKSLLLDRDDFEILFGSTALRVAEEAAADLALARQDEREEVEA